jgi:uncharacterized membrane protein YphA (DoxX/SURF4 family)
MRNPLRSPAATNLGLLIARLPIGYIFTMAGIIKIKGGIGAFVTQSAGSIPSYLPEALGRAYLYALPIVELLLGVLLILGWFTRTAAFFTALVLLSIMMAVSGWKEAQAPMPMPNSNAVLFAVALLLFFAGPGSFALDSFKFGKSSKPKPID